MPRQGCAIRARIQTFRCMLPRTVRRSALPAGLGSPVDRCSGQGPEPGADNLRRARTPGVFRCRTQLPSELRVRSPSQSDCRTGQASPGRSAGSFLPIRLAGGCTGRRPTGERPVRAPGMLSNAVMDPPTSFHVKIRWSSSNAPPRCGHRSVS